MLIQYLIHEFSSLGSEFCFVGKVNRLGKPREERQCSAGPCTWGLMLCSLCLEILNKCIFELVVCMWSMIGKWSMHLEVWLMQYCLLLLIFPMGQALRHPLIMPWHLGSCLAFPSHSLSWKLVLGSGMRRVSIGYLSTVTSWSKACQQLSSPNPS